MTLWFLRLSWPWKTQQSTPLRSGSISVSHDQPCRKHIIYNPHYTIHDKLLDFIMHALFSGVRQQRKSLPPVMTTNPMTLTSTSTPTITTSLPPMTRKKNHRQHRTIVCHNHVYTRKKENEVSV